VGPGGNLNKRGKKKTKTKKQKTSVWNFIGNRGRTHRFNLDFRLPQDQQVTLLRLNSERAKRRLMGAFKKASEGVRGALADFQN
jgi:hypothetical protein